MEIMRVDFITENSGFYGDIKEWSILYNPETVPDDTVQGIIDIFKYENFDNTRIREDYEFFFLPTSKADMLKNWVGKIKTI